MSDRVRINEWRKLAYHDPEEKLLRLRELQELVARSDLPPKVRNLRTRELNQTLEGRQAALFCYGLGIVLNTQVAFALHEDADHDVITTWRDEDEAHFCPLQLKELVPEKTKSDQTLEEILNGLEETYPRSKDLVVAIHINRGGTQDLVVDASRLNLAGLWLFGASLPDQSRWFLSGDHMSNPQLYGFEYPSAER